MPSELVIVKCEDLAATVEHLWDAVQTDYMSKCPRRAWFVQSHTFDDNHLFHRLIRLALACGFVDSESDVWDAMNKEMHIGYDID